MKKLLANPEFMYYPCRVVNLEQKFLKIALSFHRRQFSSNFTVLILVIFFAAAFQSTVFAENKRQVAQDYRVRGYEQEQQGNLDDALSWYIKAVSVDSSYAVAFNDLGLLYERLGKDDEAQNSYLSAIKADKKYLPPYSNLGYFYKNKQNLGQAIDYFRKRVQLGQPNDPWTRKAKEELRTIYHQSPFLHKRLVDREAQRLNTRMINQARAKFNEQIVNAKNHYREGLRFLKQKKYHDAINSFDTALSYTPENPKIIRARNKAIHEINQQMIRQQVSQAMQLLKDGQNESAQKRFREVLSIIPSEPK